MEAGAGGRGAAKGKEKRQEGTTVSQENRVRYKWKGRVSIRGLAASMGAGHFGLAVVTFPSYSRTTLPSVGGLKFSIIITLGLGPGDRLAHLLWFPGACKRGSW